ncbi:MAG: hypothetical protein KDB94_07065 [Acidobacteria bacterium]|nr:hypothetical protein [Acidobacteriota bacterium]
MTWTRSIDLREFELRGWLFPDEYTLAHVTDCNRRTAMLERRVELARMEASALRTMMRFNKLSASLIAEVADSSLACIVNHTKANEGRLAAASAALDRFTKDLAARQESRP